MSDIRGAISIATLVVLMMGFGEVETRALGYK